ncbi:MAG TPA: MFS transporter [Trebonia sp.]
MSRLVIGPRFRGPLSSRNFRLLAMCNVISVTGSGVSFVALPFAVLQIGGSAAAVGYVATARLIALAGVLLLGGVVADRLPRHQVIIAASAIQACAQGASAALILTGHAQVWQLAALAAAGGIAFGFYYPAARGLLPQTVRADQLAQANALDRTGQNTAWVGGFAIGGLLIGLAGAGWGLAIDAASFAIAALLLTGLRLPRTPSAKVASLLQDLLDGWHEFSSRRWLWVIVAQFALLVAVSAATIDVLGPLVADTRLGGARSWGFVAAAYTAGAVGGGLVMLRFRPRRILAVAVMSLPAFSPLLFALAVPLPAPVAIAASALAGGCMEVFTVNWATTLQQEIPADKLSRISSYDALGNCALAPIGTAIGGPLAARFGVPATLTAGGAIILILPLLILLIPEVRHVQRRSQAPVEAETLPG